MSISPTTFEFSYDGFSFTRSASCGPNEEVLSASTSFSDPGVTLSWNGGTFTVSGTFQRVFPNSTWTYIPLDQTNAVSVTTQTTGTITEIPSRIKCLLSASHNATLQVPITYTVNTKKTITINVPSIPSSGPDDPGTPGYSYNIYEYHTHTISHRICNHWDTFKTQLINVISRGKF